MQSKLKLCWCLVVAAALVLMNGCASPDNPVPAKNTDWPEDGWPTNQITK